MTARRERGVRQDRIVRVGLEEISVLRSVRRPCQPHRYGCRIVDMHAHVSRYPGCLFHEIREYNVGLSAQFIPIGAE